MKKQSPLMLAFLLMAIDPGSVLAGDIIKLKSGAKHDTRIRNGGSAKLGGTVTRIDAYARVLTPDPGCPKPAATHSCMLGMPYATETSDQVGEVTDAGKKFSAFATAVINVTDTANLGKEWNSGGSDAHVNDNGAKATETYEARAFVKDPMTVTLLPDDGPITFELDLGDLMSMLVDPAIPADETWSASISGSDETSLDDLGTLWTWSWNINSSDPKNAVFAFHSNPLLGLNDIALVSEFNSLAHYDAATGLHNLSSPFSVSVDVAVNPGQTSYTFGGEDMLDTQGGAAVAPEPGTLMLLGIAGVLTCAGKWRYRRQKQ